MGTGKIGIELPEQHGVLGRRGHAGDEEDKRAVRVDAVRLRSVPVVRVDGDAKRSLGAQLCRAECAQVDVIVIRMSSPGPEAPRESASAPWRRPQLGVSGFERYLHTLRERLPLIAAVTLVTMLVAVLYLAVADDKYRAEADLLVAPAGQDDTALTALPVIHESSDPTRDVETASRLVDSRDVAVRVKRELGLA